MTGKTLVLSDFDGTISTQDIGHEVIKRFMKGDWRELDDSYASGKIGSMAAYRRIASLMKAESREMAEYTLGLNTMDPTFADFYRFCKRRGFDFKVVSDGLDFYIRLILERHGLGDIEFFSNVLRFNGGSSVSIEFPCSNGECGRCGTCKSMILRNERAEYERIVYIGDGYSDVCPTQYADIVFGKGVLYEKCRQNNRACFHYRNFQDIADILDRQQVR